MTLVQLTEHASQQTIWLNVDRIVTVKVQELMSGDIVTAINIGEDDLLRVSEKPAEIFKALGAPSYEYSVKR